MTLIMRMNSLVRGTCSAALCSGLVLVLFLIGCSSQAPETVKIRFAPIRPLTFGVFPFRETTALRIALEPLTEWLSRRLETPVRLRLVQDYAELERLVAHGDLDLAWCSPRGQGPAGSPTTGSISDLFPLCRPVGRLSEGYHGLILARADRGIASLTDLAGKSFAFVDRHSNSGFAYPLRRLAEANLNPARDCSKLLFTGNHDRSTAALLAGAVDAIAVSEFVLRDPAVHARLGKDIRIVATTAPILPDPILASLRLPAPLQQRLRVLFSDVSTQPEGVALLASLSQSLDITGFEPIPGGKKP